MTKAKFNAAGRTVDHFKDQGCLAERVDCYNHFSKRHHDLFGIIDLVVIGDPEHPILFVQATAGDGGNHAARRAKVIASDATPKILIAGIDVAIVSWRKAGPRGKRKVWTPRIEYIKLDDCLP